MGDICRPVQLEDRLSQRFRLKVLVEVGSGLEVVLVDIIPLRVSTSQFWQLIVVSANMTILASSPALVSDLQMTYGSI
jgi:hypothetical protein